MNTRTLAMAAVGAGIACALAFAGFFMVSIVFGDHNGDAASLLLLGAASVCALATVGFLSLYVFYDAESRGMKGALWALLIFLFASLPGFLVYLLMRSPRLRSCPVCATRIGDDYVVCPSCQTRVGLGCTRCHRRVEPDWTACPYCRNDLSATDSLTSSARPRA